MSARAVGLFLRGLLQVTPVGATTYLLAHGQWWAAFPFAYAINLTWRWNARSAALERARGLDHAYALGGACGSVGGAALVAWWLT